MRIYLTGRVGVELNGDLALRERQFRGRQERLAFVYLVRQRNRTVARDELADLIWPGEEAPQAWTTALSAILSNVRRALAESGLDVAGMNVSKGFSQYRLTLPDDAWVDVEVALESIDAAEAALRMGEADRAFGPATVAWTICKRPFLSGTHVPWAAHERSMLGRVYLRSLDCIAEVRLEAGESALAVEAAREAIQIDQERESSYQLLMRSHDAAGNRAAAIRIYHELRDVLAERLGTGPSRETATLYEQLIG
ncbi:MAG: BTAD domain-containing putative transcriptional regulator [Dehalococcoidia bacterium]